MGKYCLHFHHAGQCADCVFMGNTIYEWPGLQVGSFLRPFPEKTTATGHGARSASPMRSAQVGITVHGTHRSLVENNILWDTAAAGPPVNSV